MSTLSVLEHDDENSELSSMAYLPNCGLVATGHLDGSIRLWNQEIGTSVLLTANPVH
jgi:WD40 repeat protein